MLGGIRNVAHPSISHKQTQTNRVYCFPTCKVTVFTKYPPFVCDEREVIVKCIKLNFSSLWPRFFNPSSVKYRSQKNSIAEFVSLSLDLNFHACFTSKPFSVHMSLHLWTFILSMEWINKWDYFPGVRRKNLWRSCFVLFIDNTTRFINDRNRLLIMSTAISRWKHRFSSDYRIKQRRARLVLGWVTAWEYRVL